MLCPVQDTSRLEVPSGEVNSHPLTPSKVPACSMGLCEHQLFHWCRFKKFFWAQYRDRIWHRMPLSVPPLEGLPLPHSTCSLPSPKPGTPPHALPPHSHTLVGAYSAARAPTAAWAGDADLPAGSAYSHSGANLPYDMLGTPSIGAAVLALKCPGIGAACLSSIPYALF